MIKRIKVAFYRLGSKENKKGLAPVYARIKKQGTKVVNISTEIWLLSNEWDEKKKKPKRNTPRLALLAKQLADCEDRLYRTEEEIQYEKKEVTPDEIAFRMKNAKVQYTLLTLFDYHIADMKKREGRGARKRNIQAYSVTKRKIIEYLKQQQHRCTDIMLEKLDYNFIVGFDAFMAEHYNNCISTRYKNTQRLKTVVSTGIKLGWMVVNPFAAYKSKTEYRKRQYLTIPELTAIEKLELTGNKQLDKTRDLFLFMCYTGVSYVDLEALTPDNIRTSGTGKQYIQFDRSKTGTISTAFITVITRNIIEKYTNHPTCLNMGRLLPVPPNQSMNRSLKTIAQKAGIKKPATCHIGRHTFATLALNVWGVPIETVSKLLGHRSIKTTMIYLQVTESKMEEDCTKMIEMQNNEGTRFRFA